MVMLCQISLSQIKLGQVWLCWLGQVVLCRLGQEGIVDRKNALLKIRGGGGRKLTLFTISTIKDIYIKTDSLIACQIVLVIRLYSTPCLQARRSGQMINSHVSTVVSSHVLKSSRCRHVPYEGVQINLPTLTTGRVPRCPGGGEESKRAPYFLFRYSLTLGM